MGIDNIEELAPDGNDPGDNEVPAQLKDLLLPDGDLSSVVPDNVDKEDVVVLPGDGTDGN